MYNCFQALALRKKAKENNVILSVENHSTVLTMINRASLESESTASVTFLSVTQMCVNATTGLCSEG